MRYFLSLLSIFFIAATAIAQDSSKFLKVESFRLSGKTFQMMSNPTKITEIGGDSTPIDRTTQYRTASTTKQIPLEEGQLEDRKFNNYSSAKVSDNQYLSVLFNNLSGKEIKTVSISFLVKLKGKKYFERNIKGNPKQLPNGSFYIFDSFFSTKDFSTQDLQSEIMIKGIELKDGTRLKF